MFHKGASEATQVCATLHFRIKIVFDIPLPKPHGEGETEMMVFTEKLVHQIPISGTN